MGLLWFNDEAIFYLVNDIKRAAGCTGTYLHINPTDESTLFNKDYYSRQHQATADDFKPRTVNIIDDWNDAVKFYSFHSCFVAFKSNKFWDFGDILLNYARRIMGLELKWNLPRFFQDAVQYVTERNKDVTLLQLVRHMQTGHSTHRFSSQVQCIFEILSICCKIWNSE